MGTKMIVNELQTSAITVNGYPVVTQATAGLVPWCVAAHPAIMHMPNPTYVVATGMDVMFLTDHSVLAGFSFDLNLSGVKYFNARWLTSLTDLTLSTSLTTLDLSANKLLTTLNVSGSIGLTTLDLSANTLLTTLDTTDCTSLTTLGVSGLTALASLSTYSCTSLTALDVSGCTALASLDTTGCTKMTTLDVSGCTSLIVLDTFGCKFPNTKIDAIVITLAAGSVSSGTLNANDQAIGTYNPSVAAAAAIVTLTGRSWSMTFDPPA